MVNRGENRGSSSGTQDPRHEVFSASRAGHLDTRFRRLIYCPGRLAERYVKPGSRVIDFGCGPGFFTREFARRVGDTGFVIAADVQQEMLSCSGIKSSTRGLCPASGRTFAPDTIGLPPELNETIDIVFAIFVVHEVPDPLKLFKEISSLLKPEGLFFYSEPPFIVPGTEFRENLADAERIGFKLVEKRFFFVNRAALLRKVSC